MSDPATPVVLAREPAFTLAGLTVRPSTREVTGANGAAEVLEPRVMQVLVALQRAGGGIVSRDDLTQSCWDGRVVGEDAINRVISRLRRTAEGIGAGRIRLDTVTKVGYRLVEVGQPESNSAPDHPPASVATGSGPTRRLMIGGAAAGALAAASAGIWLVSRPDEQARAAPPPEIAALMQAADAAFRQGGPEGSAQAIGLLRRVVAIRPDYADGWGNLALAYAGAARNGPPAQVPAITARARAAIGRATTIDARNVYARLAAEGLRPTLGNWSATEKVCRDGLRSHPDDPALLGTLAATLGAVGRDADAVGMLERLARVCPPTPNLAYSLAWASWCAGRIEEAERAVDSAFELFPRNIAVWFTRFYFLTYTGRAAQAIAMADDRDGRPIGVPDDNFRLVTLGARAVMTREPGHIDAAMRANLAAARLRSGQAENTIVLAAALGRLDDAFTLTDAYFFNRGFSIGDLRFSPEQGTYTGRNDRHTLMLFQPPAAPLRADPRFARLTMALGLDAYWRATETMPDFWRLD